MIKLITFDLDNTLWNADPVLVRAEQVLYQWLQENCPELAANYTINSMREYKAAIAADNPDLQHKVSALRLEMLRRGLRDVGYDLKDAEQLAKRAFDVFHHARQQVTFFDHVDNVLGELSRCYTLAALTNGNADVSIIGLDRYFEFALSADIVGRQKPDPEMFLIALERAKVTADETIHIGDHPEHDIVGAHNVGMHTIWINFESTPWRNDLAPGAGEVVPTGIANCLSEIPKLISQIANDTSK